MRLSRFHLATVKEVPADAEIASHQLMLRAGMMRKLAAGIYTWSPLGLRVLRKVEAIVREEMNRAGAIELLMPSVQPKELWDETGRWEKFGGQLLKIKDRKDAWYCYGPTHEEVITDFARNELKSYKQLPVNFYQIQTKFRDEIRPRFGIMRAREFLMKDAYSFHSTQADPRRANTTTCTTPTRASSRGSASRSVPCRPTPARSAATPATSSRCSPIPARTRSRISTDSDYAANIEMAEALAPATRARSAGCRTRTRRHADAEDHRGSLGIPQGRSEAVRQDDRRARPRRTGRAVRCAAITRSTKSRPPSSPNCRANRCSPTRAEILAATGARPGFIGPVGLPRIDAGHRRPERRGARRFRLRRQPGRHALPRRELGARRARHARRRPAQGRRRRSVTGRQRARSGSRAASRSATFSSSARNTPRRMGATVLDDAGKAAVMHMGCYGIGVSRIVAAAIEQNHDDGRHRLAGTDGTVARRDLPDQPRIRARRCARQRSSCTPSFRAPASMSCSTIAAFGPGRCSRTSN